MKRGTFCAPIKKAVPWSLAWNPGLTDLVTSPPTDTKTTTEVPADPGIQKSEFWSHSSSSTATVTSAKITAKLSCQTLPPPTSTVVAETAADSSNIQFCNSNTTKDPPVPADKADALLDPSQAETSQLCLTNKPNNQKTGLKPPRKPESNFMIFVREKRAALIKKGISPEKASDKAVRMWRISSPAVKDKYQGKYEKQKAKYEIDMVKYREKVQSKADRKGMIFFQFKKKHY